MKIIRAHAKKTCSRLRRVLCSLFVVAAVVAAVGAVASPRANQGGSTFLKAMANPAEGAKVGDVLPANIIIVTNTNDSGPGSLRDALAVANDGDTIDATGVSGTILLTSGELGINHSVTINGPGAENLAVDGNATFRVFVNGAGDVTIAGLTITNGFSNDGGAGISHYPGTLTVNNCTISGNIGGGISNFAVDLCCATLTVSNSTISGNSGDYGGGILNRTVMGGAFVTVSNSTISGNLANYGGGIANWASTSPAAAQVTISNSTLSGNSATGNGGGVYNSVRDFGFAGLDLGSTILKASGSDENIFNDGGTVTSHGYNLSSDDAGGYLTGPGDQINTDPVLGPLQDNGGPTFTHALLPGSPAINAGDPGFTPPPFYDQRGPGFDRLVNGRIDVGSLEVQGFTPSPTPTPTFTSTPTPTPTFTRTPTPTPTFTPTPTPTPRPSPTPRPHPTVHPRPIS